MRGKIWEILGDQFRKKRQVLASENLLSLGNSILALFDL